MIKNLRKLQLDWTFKWLKPMFKVQIYPPQKIRFIYWLVMKTHNMIHIQLSVPLCTYWNSAACPIPSLCTWHLWWICTCRRDFPQFLVSAGCVCLQAEVYRRSCQNIVQKRWHKDQCFSLTLNTTSQSHRKWKIPFWWHLIRAARLQLRLNTS